MIPVNDIKESLTELDSLHQNFNSFLVLVSQFVTVVQKFDTDDNDYLTSLDPSWKENLILLYSHGFKHAGAIMLNNVVCLQDMLNHMHEIAKAMELTRN
ncbi:MAG: hypothetical protein WCO02_09960 [Bacteroidota bacterium]